MTEPEAKASPPDAPEARKREREPSESAPEAGSEKSQPCQKSRKRTKTGCLTCRKRRIKCGEERPTCANCIKSKRVCEGYAPRLTFKDPVNLMHSQWSLRGMPYQFQGVTAAGAAGQYARSAGLDGTSQLPHLAPRPMSQGHPMTSFYGHPGLASPAAMSLAGGYFHHGLIQTTPADFEPGLLPPYAQPASADDSRNSFPPPLASVPSQPANSQFGAGRPPETPATPQSSVGSKWLESAVASELASNSGLREGQLRWHAPLSVNEMAPTLTTQTSTESSTPPSEQSHQPDPYPHHVRHQPPEESVRTMHRLQDSMITPVDAEGNGHWDAKTNDALATEEIPNFHWQGKLENTQSSPAMPPMFHPDRPVPHELEPVDEEELYDVESDEEQEPWQQRDYHWSIRAGQNLDVVLAIARSDQHLHPNPNFLRPDMLTHYAPKLSASPLMDPTTARVFCHFITTTGPSLSAFERRVADPTAIFQGRPVPERSRGLWTYTLPVLALADAGLLQAMLALSSLQIARLQQAPLTAPMRHYHYALRRVARAVGTPARRTAVATIAATLILAHFEAVTAEHKKWTSHLAGAAQLLMEIDFHGAVRRIREQAASPPGDGPANGLSGLGAPGPPAEQGPPVDGGADAEAEDALPYVPSAGDEEFVGSLMGFPVRYGRDRGRVVDEREPTGGRMPLTARDRADFRTKQDLWWWFLKMDMIQSLVRGGSLL